MHCCAGRALEEVINHGGDAQGGESGARWCDVVEVEEAFVGVGYVGHCGESGDRVGKIVVGVGLGVQALELGEGYGAGHVDCGGDASWRCAVAAQVEGDAAGECWLYGLHSRVYFPGCNFAVGTVGYWGYRVEAVGGASVVIGVGGGSEGFGCGDVDYCGDLAVEEAVFGKGKEG